MKEIETKGIIKMMMNDFSASFLQLFDSTYSAGGRVEIFSFSWNLWE
jgi:hypothetical protein